jgi:amino acid transporter
LGTFGETAIVEVARELLGRPGAIAILIAGVLATISSANASILSASRMVYALSRDAILPSRAGTINLRYGTPHLALLASGGPIVVLVLTGQVELLAEVASFLHLLMYGLIGVTVIVLRRSDPAWYEPSYRMPGVPALPIVAALASFGLALQMQLGAIVVGLLVMALSLGWYLYYARTVDLKGVFTND